MDTAERRELMTRYTEEVVTDEELAEVLDGESPEAYIGYAPTGEMHIGHFTTIRKLADFLRAGVDVTVLVADLHAHLDDEKSPFDLLDARTEYYQQAIEAMVDVAGADPGDIEFVQGREFELDQPYTLDLYRMLADTTVSRATRAGSEVVRQSDNPKLGGLVYTLMQSLDVAALDADIAYGGIDQRGIYMLARELLPDYGYDKPVCVFAPLLSGLTGGKMSASDAASKVNLTDDRETVREKLGQAYCPMGEVEENGVLEYVRYLVFPLLDEDGDPFEVERPEKFGGDLVYEDYESLEADFVSEELHPQDLKNATADYIADAVAPVRERLLADPELLAAAYPEQYD
ncbi:tyrosine--tRNA ligase [Halomarina salina]|uniref:Tyrosine--tRNA ligase n=1 Tax=Halomarina salina TaxID=1872699 RepID=A0ABD5RSJ3_9EURY|nr:tyrosine--tRNA ligase [Halomarina salina]